MPLNWSLLKYRIGRLLKGDEGGAVQQDSYEEAITYLLDEVSDLRIIVRDLAARATARTDDGSQTRESFSYQWQELPEGDHLVGDPEFERNMIALATKYSGFPKEWFAGKTVLDAGCGNGRWSYAFAKMGAKVTAVDQSVAGVANLSRLLKDKHDFQAIETNLLNPLPFDTKFDLVWCYGVAHHTGDTKRVFDNVVKAVKPGGRLFLMIYGEPRSKIEFSEINHYVSLRRQTQFMTFEEKVRFLESKFPKNLVHGYFDAISPHINDLHRFDEIEGWLRAAGFQSIRKTLESRNHHLVADRPVAR